MGFQIKIWLSVMKPDVDFINAHMSTTGLKACLLHILGDTTNE